MEVSDQFHATAALPRERNNRYPLDGRLNGPQSLAVLGGEKKFPRPC
jgi:hypothetical protein